jgi:hypothetical protein
MSKNFDLAILGGQRSDLVAMGVAAKCAPKKDKKMVRSSIFAVEQKLQTWINTPSQQR